MGKPLLLYDEETSWKEGDTMRTPETERFCGQEVDGATLAEIKEIVRSCSGLSRTELANTVCELWDWKRPRGGLKTVELSSILGTSGKP